MPVNEFEQQAKKLLDEVQIRPNKKIWEDVEKRIREKRKRRWLIIFPLTAGLMLGGYFIAEKYSGKQYFKNNQSNIDVTENELSKNNASAKELPENSKQFDAGVKSTEVEKINEELNRKNSIVNADNTKVNLAIPQETEVNKKGFQVETIDKKEVKLVITEEKKKNVPALMNFVDKPENSIKNNNDLSIGLTQNDKLAHIEVIKQEQTKKETDSVKQANSYTEKVELKPGEILQGNKVKSRERIKNKWRVGIAISAGLSNVKNDLFGLDLNMTKALSYQSGPATASQQIKQPSPNYSAFAYQAGFYLQKKISKKSSFSVGVNYALYQTRIAVGDKIDSLALGLNTNLYAAAGAGNSAAGTKYNYHSQLHYLELPIVFTTQINKGKKIPLQWNAGVIFGRLISSNYLHYDTTARGIYFKDNNLLHKTSVSLQTGFGITFFNNKSMPVTISPHLQFALTDFIKNDLDKKYLLFGGLRFQMLLDNGKKK